MYIVHMLIGAALTGVGGFLAIWYLTKKTAVMRKQEVMVEKQIEANRDGFNRMTEFRSMLRQNQGEQVEEWIRGNEQWFYNARLFLPGKFADKWLAIRENWQRAARLQNKVVQMNDEMRKGAILEEIGECESSCSKLAEEALKEIYRDMNISPITVDEPEAAA